MEERAYRLPGEPRFYVGKHAEGFTPGLQGSVKAPELDV